MLPGTVTGSRIFISYRRGDSSAHAGRLSDRLVAEFGADGVFMDVDTIEPGADFVDYIDDAVGSCDVLIALIGDEWLECRDDIGNRRLEDPDDFVRLEVAAGLERDIRVVPVLVEGATMPRAHELPEPLRRLARRNALEITDTRWRHDVGRLVETIKKVLEGKGTGEAIREAEAEVAPAPAPEGATAAEAPATAGRPPWELTPAPAAEARPSYGTAPGGYEPTNPSYQDGTAGAYQPPPPPREGVAGTLVRLLHRSAPDREHEGHLGPGARDPLHLPRVGVRPRDPLCHSGDHPRGASEGRRRAR